MSKQINYGWLNDYSGKVFAPITVSSAVLVNLSKDGNQTTTTLPLDKFLATQLITTKNYINSKLTELDNKINSIRQHIYYMDGDPWSDQVAQGEFSNPTSIENPESYAEARAKTIQSQIIILQERCYNKYNTDVYNTITGRSISSEWDHGVKDQCTFLTEDQYNIEGNTLQQQLIQQSTRLFNLEQSVQLIVDPSNLGKRAPALLPAIKDNSGTTIDTYTLKIADQPIRSDNNIVDAKNDIPVRQAIRLASDITIGRDIATVADSNTNPLAEKAGSILQVEADSKTIGQITGIIYTTSPDGVASSTSSYLTLAKHLPDIYDKDTGEVLTDYKPLDYEGWVLSDGVQSDEDGPYLTIKKYHFNRQGLLVKTSHPSTKIRMGEELFNKKPTQINHTQANKYKLLCLDENAKTLYNTSTDNENGIYIETFAAPTEGTNKQSPPVLMGAAWNDYAEYRRQNEVIEPGYCATPSRNGKLQKTTKRLQYCDGIVSDTFGFSIGKSDAAQTPLAVSGRVLAHPAEPIESYEIGDPVCAGPDGKISKMTREEVKEYPDRVVGTVSEIPEYEKWNNVSTNNRIWIKVK